MAALAGKTCLILSSETMLFRAVIDTLGDAGADVMSLEIAEANDAAWDDELLNSSDRSESIDVIVNIGIPDNSGAVGELTLPVFRKIYETSYIRTWLALKYGILTLRVSGGGSFIKITSVDGKYGARAAAARCAASNCIANMTRAAALECAAKKDNVRVNVLMVGDIIPGQRDTYAPGHVSPEDVAAAVAHLASDAAIYITGLIMPVDNGRVRS